MRTPKDTALLNNSQWVVPSNAVYSGFLKDLDDNLDQITQPHRMLIVLLLLEKEAMFADIQALPNGFDVLINVLRRINLSAALVSVNEAFSAKLWQVEGYLMFVPVRQCCGA